MLAQRTQSRRRRGRGSRSGSGSSSADIGRWLAGVRGYRGTFMSDDRLPDLAPGEGAIVNLGQSGDATRDGTHWIALYHARPGIILYADPLGMLPDSDVTEQFPPFFSVQQLPVGVQDDSDLCGEYAAYFLSRLLQSGSIYGHGIHLETDPAAVVTNRRLLRGLGFTRNG